MVDYRPILVHKREEPVHMVRNVFEMRRRVISDLDRVLAISSAKLGDVRDCRAIKGPQRVFVKSLYPFLEADFYAVGEQVILP